MKQFVTMSDNLRLVVESIPSLRSVSFGVFFGTGSAAEKKSENGISHMLEHMMFKGTDRYTQLEIVEKFDNVGARINAFTSKLETAYYCICTDEHLRYCFELLAHIVTKSTFPTAELEKEKGVVLEEISMCNDDYEDVAIEETYAMQFHGSTIARPVLGSAANVRGFTSEALHDYFNLHYTSGNAVVSIVGNVTIEDAIALTKEFFVDKLPHSKLRKRTAEGTPSIATRSKMVKKDSEQANIVVGFPACNYYDDDKFTLALVNNCLGNSMSSRLFQTLREKLGLAYSVYSFPSHYLESGLFAIYVGTNPDNTQKCVEEIIQVLHSLKTDGLTDTEFSRSREQTKVSFLLAQEQTSSLMRAYARAALLHNELFDIDALIAKYNSITQSDLNNVINKVFDFSKLTLAYVGQKPKVDIATLLPDGE